LSNHVLNAGSYLLNNTKEKYMSNNKTAVFAIFKERDQVEHAINNLKASDFCNTDISVLFPDKEGTKDFAHEKSTKAPEGAAAGGTAGAVMGGTFGWLVGMGSLAIPGVGPLIAAGPIMAALAGADGSRLNICPI
jgi:hypothetical protein